MIESLIDSNFFGQRDSGGKLSDPLKPVPFGILFNPVV
jgi:hypothetical protein